MRRFFLLGILCWFQSVGGVGAQVVFSSVPAVGVDVGAVGSSGYLLRMGTVDGTAGTITLEVRPANGLNFSRAGRVQIRSGDRQVGTVMAQQTYAAGATGPFFLTFALGETGEGTPVSHFVNRWSLTTGAVDPAQWDGPVVVTVLPNAAARPPVPKDLRLTASPLAAGRWRMDAAWSAVPGFYYSLEASPNLKTWEAVPAFRGRLAEAVAQLYSGLAVVDPAAGPGQFFRVKVDAKPVPPPGFVRIPAGIFRMGNAFSADMTGEGPVHGVELDEFVIGQNEVTLAEWQATATAAGLAGYVFSATATGKAADHPVVGVSWQDAVAWCNARSEQEGLQPCYSTPAGAPYRNASDPAVVADFSRNGYRLPTEAEWEKAARGGLGSKQYPWGDAISHVEANFDAGILPATVPHPDFALGAVPYTAPAGYFTPNPLGLHQMAGNVGEWCHDRFDPGFYAISPTANPTGPADGAAFPNRVVRGGSWADGVADCRVSARQSLPPGAANDRTGFRMARKRQGGSAAEF